MPLKEKGIHPTAPLPLCLLVRMLGHETEATCGQEQRAKVKEVLSLIIVKLPYQPWIDC